MFVIHNRHGVTRSIRTLLVVLLAAVAGQRVAAQDESVKQEPVMLAHRGLVEHAPENTLPAFAAAIALEVAIELDVYQTRDGQLVVIHDDTVDESDIRRGRATLSSLWGRSVAVQAGDYVFASAAAFMCDTGDIQVIRRFSQTIMELASGQLQEAADVHVPDQTRDDYLGRIYNKTASLFETASESGAILSGAPEETAAPAAAAGK